MKQNKKGILVLASMVLSISLMCGAQVVKATDGETSEILLKDANSNGKIDEVHIMVGYTGATGVVVDTEIETEGEKTAEKFTVTDAESNNSVTISSIVFEIDNGDGTATFKLVLDESDLDLNVNTSGTALDVVYTPTNTATDLKVTDGSAPISIAAIDSDITEKDGAQPIILTAVDQYENSLDSGADISVDANIIITFSESMDTTTLDDNGEWSISPDPGDWLAPVWSNDDKTLTLEQTVNFIHSDIEVVTLTAPLAIFGAIAEDRELQNSPDDSVVDNPFTFTITDSADEDEDEDEDITPPEGSLPGPAEPNSNSGVTLYRVREQHRVYVIKNKKKHWIKSPKEFEDGGYSWSEIQEISAELLEEYPEAETLVSELLRAVGSHKVYKLEGGKKHWIRTAGEFNAAGYKWGDIQEVSAETLASYQNAVLSDLLRAIGDHKVYRIKDGKKCWIKTIREFNAAGHKWEDVEEVSAQDLDDYPDSDSEDV